MLGCGHPKFSRGDGGGGGGGRGGGGRDQRDHLAGRGRHGARPTGDPARGAGAAARARHVLARGSSGANRYFWGRCKAC